MKRKMLLVALLGLTLCNLAPVWAQKAEEISGSGKGAVTCAISYQCCDTHICFPPVNKSYEIQI